MTGDSTAPDAMPASASPALDYASVATARRGWVACVRRWWPVWALPLVAWAGIAYGPGVWRHWQLMRLQGACLSAEVPGDRPVFDADPARAAGLVAGWPGEYALDARRSASRADPRWAALAGHLNVVPWPYVDFGPPWATAFCHERFTPSGRRRLVVVEHFFPVTVVEPGGWGGGRPRVVTRESIGWDAAAYAARAAADDLPGGTTVGAGSADPADPSRFTVPIALRGVPGVLEYQLGDDDRVTSRLRDPAGFTARAEALKAKVGAGR